MRFPHRFSAVMLALALAVAAVPTSALAAIDAFLDLEGIKGESTDQDHKDWIEVLSQTQPAPSAAAAGKVKVNEFVIKKLVDKASPMLFKNCAKGTHFDKVLLHVRKAGGQHVEFLVYTLQNVVISSITPVAGSNPPQESLTLTYASMTTSTFAAAAAAAPPASAVSH